MIRDSSCPFFPIASHSSISKRFMAGGKTVLAIFWIGYWAKEPVDLGIITLPLIPHIPTNKQPNKETTHS